MDLTTFTSFDTIRALLGVTDDELTDEDLSLPIFFVNLRESFADVSPDLLTAYTNLKQTPTASLSAAERRFVEVADVFAAYVVAVQMLDTLPMLAMRSEEDARAKYEKYADPFARVEPSVRASYAVALRRLQQTYNGLGASPLPVYSFNRTLTAVAGLSPDPVTGA